MAQFPAVITLDALDEKQGFLLFKGFGARGSVPYASAGDVNGDGFDDLLSGNPVAESTDGSGYDFRGATFLTFGRAEGFGGGLAGAERIRFDGVSASNNSGSAIARAGDVNGDGFDDIIIGAPGASPNGDQSGSSYVVFGKAGGFAARQSLGTLNGANGFRIDGATAGDFSGVSVASAGDLNRDGFDDIVIGAPDAAPNGIRSGSSYVVFGKAEGFTASLALSSLDGRNGFRLDGGPAGNQSGQSVASAGDVNGDGLPDLFIGADNNNEGTSTDLRNASGYIVFGRADGYGAKVDLTTLDGSNGFKIAGTLGGMWDYTVPRPAGDVNGDGIDDLVIGVPGASPNGVVGAGSTYVVFGRKGGFSANLDLSDLAATDGFRIDGTSENLGSGVAVDAAGDLNGDGFDDVIVKALGNYDRLAEGRDGQSYVVFGRAGGYPSNLKLSDLDGTNGFRVDSGRTGTLYENIWSTYILPWGDVNGDGIDDIIGVAREDRRSDDGFAYIEESVIYGQGPDTAVTRTGTAAGETLVGGAFADTLRGLGGDDRLFGNGGNDLLDGGTGRDRLKGGAGDDLYAVDHAGDRVFEAAGQGNDTVVASVTYALAAGQAVETLQLASATAQASLKLFGNEFANTLIGNNGANLLDGGAGADQLYGKAGDDTYAVDRAEDRVFEVKGQGKDAVVATVSYALAAGQEIETLQLAKSTGTQALKLTGNEFANTLLGNGGANALNGLDGSDVLSGRGGADTFTFSTKLGGGNIDRITDFASDDTLKLEDSIFAALAPGALAASAFKNISTGKADADDHILYKQATGQLFYDADAGGKGAAVWFATLDNKAALTAADILVV